MYDEENIEVTISIYDILRNYPTSIFKSDIRSKGIYGLDDWRFVHIALVTELFNQGITREMLETSLEDIFKDIEFNHYEIKEIK